MDLGLNLKVRCHVNKNGEAMYQRNRGDRKLTQIMLWFSSQWVIVCQIVKKI